MGEREGASRADSIVGYLRVLRSLESSFFFLAHWVMALVWFEGFVCWSVLVVEKLNKMKMQSYFVHKNVIFSRTCLLPNRICCMLHHAMLWFFFLLDHWTIDRDMFV